MKKSASIILLFLCGILQSQTANIDFESTPAGTYTSATAVNGWTISSQSNTSGACSSSTVWTAGSPEFSIVSTPIASVGVIGSILQSPLGGNNIARLNNSAGDGSVTKLSRTVFVTSAERTLQFAYAGMWEGDVNHPCCEQSGFSLVTKNQSGVIQSCHSNTMVSRNGCFSGMSFSVDASGTYWTNWQVRYLDLTAYLNTFVTFEITVNDCVFGSNLGTLFFDAAFLYSPPPVNFCSGSSQATINGPLGYSSYQWYAPVTGSIAAPQGTMANLTLSNPVAGSVYTVQLTTATGCLYQASYTLAYTSVSIGAISSNSSCSGGASGSATLFASGSGTGYTYTWLNSSNSVVGTGSVVSNLFPGIYTASITAFASAGCGSSTSTVSINTAPKQLTSVIKPYCGNEAYLNVSSGSNFQWYNGTVSIAANQGGTANSYTVNPAVNNSTYYLTRLSINGCNDSLGFTLTSTPAGSLSLSNKPLVCPGGSNGMAVISMTTANGAPVGLNSFSVFSTGSLTTSYSSALNQSSVNTFSASGLQADGTYSVNAFDGLCKYNLGFTVTPVTANFSLSLSSATLCSGSSSAAAVNFPTPLPTLLHTYSWSPSTFLVSTNAQNTIIAPTIPTGSATSIIYTVVVTPTVLNCPTSKTMEVTVLNPMIPTITAVPALCNNAGDYTISANPGGGQFLNYINSYMNYLTGVITPSSALPGAYTFTYLTTYGPCVASSAGSFTINPLPVISVSGNTLFCEGNSTTLLANGADTYIWSSGSTTPYTNITPTSTSTYTVQGSSVLSGCTNSTAVTLSIVPYPQLSITGNTLLCPGETASLVAMGAYSYQWSNGTSSYLNTVSPNTTTTYSLIGTSYMSSCSSTAAITVSTSDCNFVGLTERNFDNVISVYPNPTNGKITLESEKEIGFELYDAPGRMIFQDKTKQTTFNFDLDTYPNGVYFLKLYTATENKTLKLVKTD